MPSRDPAAMAAAIHRLLTDPSTASARAAAAQARFEHAFTLDVMVGKVRRLYEEVVA